MDRTSAFEELDPLGLELAYLEPRDGEHEEEQERIPAELLADTPFAESAGEEEEEE